MYYLRNELSYLTCVIPTQVDLASSTHIIVVTKMDFTVLHILFKYENSGGGEFRELHYLPLDKKFACTCMTTNTIHNDALHFTTAIGQLWSRVARPFRHRVLIDWRL